MPGVLPSHQTMGHSMSRELGVKPLRLFVRHQRIGVAVDDEGRWRLLGDEVERRQLPERLDLLIAALALQTEDVPGELDRLVLQDAAPSLPVIDQVRGRAEAS